MFPPDCPRQLANIGVLGALDHVNDQSILDAHDHVNDLGSTRVSSTSLWL